MARSTIAVASPTTNSSAIMTATAIIPGATGADAYRYVAEIKDHSFCAVVTNNGTVTGPVWVKASDSMEASGVGDLTIQVGGSVTKVIGPLEGCQVRQSTGDINIDSGITGSIYGIQLP